jgi:Ca2+-binding EF-hand superfamily protein
MKSILAAVAVITLGVAIAPVFAEDAAQSTTPTTSQTQANGGRQRAQQQDPEAAFKLLDTDSDGKVSLDEFKASAIGQRNPTMAETLFKTMDKDSDGYVTLDEYKTTMATRQRGQVDPEALFKQLDTNGDGSLSLDEFKAGVTAGTVGAGRQQRGANGAAGGNGFNNAGNGFGGGNAAAAGANGATRRTRGNRGAGQQAAQ